MATETLPTMEQLRAYMRATGWVSREPGPVGALWLRGSALIPAASFPVKA